MKFFPTVRECEQTSQLSVGRFLAIISYTVGSQLFEHVGTKGCLDRTP